MSLCYDRVMSKNRWWGCWSVALVMLGCMLVKPWSLATAATLTPSIIQEPQAAGEFPVFVFLDPQKAAVIGTDLLISYDPKRVSYVRAENGTLFEAYHQPVHDEQRHTIRFSATNSYGVATTIAGLFGKIWFQTASGATAPLVSGATPAAIRFDWSTGATNDTNVVSKDGKELLVAAPVLSVDPTLDTRLSSQEVAALDQPTWDALKSGGVLSGSVAGASIVKPEPTKRESSWLVLVVVAFAGMGATLWLWRKRRGHGGTLGKTQ